MWQKAVFFLLIAFILSPWGSPVYALALGLAMALTIGNPFPTLTGKPSKYLLQISVAMLGFGMDLSSVYSAGKNGIGFIVFVVAAALILGFLIGKVLNVSSRVRTLVSSGTAICGGSAIAAIGPAIKAENDEMTVSLGTIFVLNAVALFAFPIIGHSVGLSQQQFGLWAAVAIQDTSSVVGAATSFGPESLAVAATVKLARTLFIIPLAIALAFYHREVGVKSKVTLPWFIFFFLGAATVKTYGSSLIFPSIFDAFVNLAKAGLAVTLFLIGLSLSLKTLRSVGWRPLALGAILWVIIASAVLAAVLRFG
ncbi:putative sulfate exporter family transporter [soil metagenome]